MSSAYRYFFCSDDRRRRTGETGRGGRERAAPAVCITNPSSLSAVTSRYSKVFLHRHIRPPAVCLFFAPQRKKSYASPPKKVFLFRDFLRGPRSSPPLPKSLAPAGQSGKKVLLPDIDGWIPDCRSEEVACANTAGGGG